MNSFLEAQDTVVAPPRDYYKKREEKREILICGLTQQKYDLERFGFVARTTMLTEGQRRRCTARCQVGQPYVRGLFA